MHQSQQHLWTTPTNAPTTTTTTALTLTTAVPSMDTTSNHNNNNNNNNNNNIHEPNMEIRRMQRTIQMDDEMEHVQISNESQRELLQDTLQKLRQRIHDMEQDNWKYDIVR